jgi:hypothetical protein
VQGLPLDDLDGKVGNEVPLRIDGVLDHRALHLCPMFKIF